MKHWISGVIVAGLLSGCAVAPCEGDRCEETDSAGFAVGPEVTSATSVWFQAKADYAGGDNRTVEVTTRPDSDTNTDAVTWVSVTVRWLGSANTWTMSNVSKNGFGFSSMGVAAPCASDPAYQCETFVSAAYVPINWAAGVDQSLFSIDLAANWTGTADMEIENFSIYLQGDDDQANPTAPSYGSAVGVPLMVKYLTSESVNYDTTRLRWETGVSTSDDFYVERRASSSSTWSAVKGPIAPLAADAQYVEDVSRPCGGHHYRVRQTDSSGTTYYSTTTYRYRSCSGGRRGKLKPKMVQQN